MVKLKKKLQVMPKCIPIYIIGETGGFNSWRSRELEGGGFPRYRGIPGNIKMEPVNYFLTHPKDHLIACMYRRSS